MQPIITGTTISNFLTTTYRTSDGFDLAPKIQQYIPSCGTKSDEQLSVGQSQAADLEVTMVPAWVLQQTGTMITLGSPAAVRSQYQARDSGYLTLCSACSGYADFRHPLHAEQRINVHPSYSLSIHQRRRHWQGHDPCCAVAYRQQKSYSFKPPFASKRPFHHLDQKLEHLQHW